MAGSDSEKAPAAKAPAEEGKVEGAIKNERISIRELYKHSSAWDKFLVYFGMFMSFLAGVT